MSTSITKYIDVFVDASVIDDIEAGVGVMVYNRVNGALVKIAKNIGIVSGSTEAEYMAIEYGITILNRYFVVPNDYVIRIYSDNQSSIALIKGEEITIKPDIKNMIYSIFNILSAYHYNNVEWYWIPRKQNNSADILSKLSHELNVGDIMVYTTIRHNIADTWGYGDEQ